jgi:hypothetical protein
MLCPSQTAEALHRHLCPCIGHQPAVWVKHKTVRGIGSQIRDRHELGDNKRIRLADGTQQERHYFVGIALTTPLM